ncbi:DUF1289 domain-containing protein [Azospirillum sp. TSO22-1]|uniref:DUF1289 domain-containing protein n=1 Tax=Azospirillum sp. TSO22-1 TaxID=716789 RepID=UPI000D6189E9|nr:DUF1289 domain-containing protein [Azospirillum sp. TSO22-1]PWC53081.1 hypothetical protein TSO221_11785 [Azospirillum sp. TSO22-1]
MGKNTTDNPCVKACSFDAADLCRACFRTLDEARRWKRLPDGEKEAVNAHVRPLMDAGGKGGRKRLRKLDRKIARLEEKLAALRAEREAAAGAA